LVTLANIQLQYGDEVTVLTLLHSGILAAQLDPDVPVISLRRGWKFNPFTMYRFARISRQFDLIHVHSAHNLRYVFLASRLFGIKQPIFFHEHFGNIEINKSVSWHQRLIYPRVTLISVSKLICLWAIHHVGVPNKKVYLLYNIVPTTPYISNSYMKEEKGVSILITGNILRSKNIVFALEVVSALLQNTPGSLTILGRIVDPVYFQELKVIIDRLGLASNVHFIHDCIDIQPVLHQFDIGIHTSLFESGPLVLIEYLAQGLPFLSYRTGEVARIVETHFPEFVIDNFEIDAWVESLNRLLSKTGKEYGLELRSFYEEKFSEEIYYQKCHNIYKSVLHF